MLFWPLPSRASRGFVYPGPTRTARSCHGYWASTRRGDGCYPTGLRRVDFGWGFYRGMDWRAVVAVAVFGAMVAVTSFTRRMEPDKIALLIVRDPTPTFGDEWLLQVAKFVREGAAMGVHQALFVPYFVNVFVEQATDEDLAVVDWCADIPSVRPDARPRSKSTEPSWKQLRV